LSREVMNQNLGTVYCVKYNCALTNPRKQENMTIRIDFECKTPIWCQEHKKYHHKYTNNFKKNKTRESLFLYTYFLET
jgi:hypothetical protein